jgi:hypothetical protein
MHFDQFRRRGREFWPRGNISEYGVGSLACRIDHVAFDAGDETLDREIIHRRVRIGAFPMLGIVEKYGQAPKLRRQQAP